jgi:hypothetical protein
MSAVVNWKQKYTELKAKFMESVDMAFRLGFEQGAQQASQDAAMQQAQAAQQMAQQPPGAGGGDEGPVGGQGPTSRPEEDQDFADQEYPASKPAGPGKGIEPMQESEHPEGSELDQHIAKLESMISKSEEFSVDDLKKTVNDLKFQIEMRKSARAIPEIAKALHKPSFKIGVQASHNLTNAAKSAVNMQERIVTDIMEKWEQEEKRASKDILSQLSIEGLTKSED